ncbi:hypothetical protein CLAFUW4_13732 [Fulvia fulva]|uniref:AHC1-like C2H2 zinc-finger domain-containing protein n=1 Tax=Passalora fulva TaxID=5499 RepID=A0A9Q8PKS7_PASFU|nr:uncharacterized protein CLAFUR5_13580 [Fulvia fulva]KAK4610441.1 hypothetical protein CLAFUR4_13735 [Fulvia fulva]KAK4611038.1 hypothetical protein CLAFUR0_13739 [Fulvia fulva]UJO24315.1 hypothetical protein CLAFUR5_13580 [Fulvia fulva]WPV22159.1 hypothetical protein CLAFUW4_13732 [Fulvia fulva]WPV37289.1 hypothetical protein CLAFUW7_13740 [Fulvia fulva]
MQSMFRLPWCGDNHDQFKLSEKAHLDKMRPSPVVEMPNMLHHIKRKRSNADTTFPQIAPSPKKLRPEVESAQQLPAPTAPFVNSHVRNPPQAEPRLQAPQAHPTLPVATGSTILKDSQAQAASSLAANSMKQQDHAPAVKATPAGSSDGYFAPRTSHDMESKNLPDALSGLTPLQQTIENEFNIQILMKHNELRLIEQELAKCQIALEQLRRCELRPYPGTSGPELCVSEGRGAAVVPPPGFSRPSHPAPYGVTDGPYSRHYRHWLLNDPQFDSISHQTLAQAEYLANTAGRATRNNGQHHSRHASKSVKSSTRGSDAQLVIPNYPPPAPVKDKNAPLVLRRSTDNQLVKLICKDCKRGNFSSIQGFLNHCRIAHKQDYKSHDQAAIDCGQLMDEQELANLPAETHATPAPKSSHATSRSVSQPTVTMPKASLNFVHPLNTPAATPISTPKPTPPYKVNNARPIAPVLPVKSGSLSSNFKPSSQMPRLSAHFAKHNLAGDLEQAIANAKAKVDFSADDDMQTPDTPDVMSPALPFQGGARMPLGTAHLAAASGTDRPVSRKGFRQPTQQRPRPAPLAPAPPRGMHLHDSTLSSPHDATVSPHSADNAPGLVSDHEDEGSPSDDEDHSAIEVAPRPLPTVGRSCGEDSMDLDVRTDDEIDQHGVIIRRNSMIAQEAREIRSAGSPSRTMGGK